MSHVINQLHAEVVFDARGMLYLIKNTDIALGITCHKAKRKSVTI